MARTRVEIQITIGETRPRMWPVARALKPLWRALPHEFACNCIFVLLGSQWSFNNGKTWEAIRCH